MEKLLTLFSFIPFILCTLLLGLFDGQRPYFFQATSEAAAEKQIQQLLFPRSRRKKLRTHGDGYRNPDPY